MLQLDWHCSRKIISNLQTNKFLPLFTLELAIGITQVRSSSINNRLLIFGLSFWLSKSSPFDFEITVYFLSILWQWRLSYIWDATRPSIWIFCGAYILSQITPKCPPNLVKIHEAAIEKKINFTYMYFKHIWHIFHLLPQTFIFRMKKNLRYLEGWGNLFGVLELVDNTTGAMNETSCPEF